MLRNEKRTAILMRQRGYPKRADLLRQRDNLGFVIADERPQNGDVGNRLNCAQIR